MRGRPATETEVTAAEKIPVEEDHPEDKEVMARITHTSQISLLAMVLTSRNGPTGGSGGGDTTAATLALAQTTLAMIRARLRNRTLIAVGTDRLLGTR